MLSLVSLRIAASLLSSLATKADKSLSTPAATLLYFHPMKWPALLQSGLLIDGGTMLFSCLFLNALLKLVIEDSCMTYFAQPCLEFVAATCRTKMADRSRSQVGGPQVDGTGHLGGAHTPHGIPPPRFPLTEHGIRGIPVMPTPHMCRAIAEPGLHASTADSTQVPYHMNTCATEQE